MTTFDDDSGKPEHVPGLRFRSGGYYIATSLNGKKFKKSTGTSDLNLARQILEELRDCAALQAKRRPPPEDRPKYFQSPKRQERIAQGWTQPPLGNDLLARRQRQEFYRSKEWIQRIRGMVDFVLGGFLISEAAEAHGLAPKTAFNWMFKNRFWWIIEMVDADKPAAAATGAKEDDSAQ